MSTCRARDAIRHRTLANLTAGGWKDTPTLEFDDPSLAEPLERHTALVRRILWRAAKQEEMLLLLEDDLDFNLHFLHNLEAWGPLRQFVGGHFYASLYNPGVQFLETCRELTWGRACPESVFGAQALLISQATVRYIVTCWGVESCLHADLRLARLAARVCPVLYHQPSLVQHEGRESLWGGPFHCASDFDKTWKARV